MNSILFSLLAIAAAISLSASFFIAFFSPTLKDLLTVRERAAVAFAFARLKALDKARAGARLVALLGSIVVMVIVAIPMLTVGAIGFVVGMFGSVYEVLKEVATDAYESGSGRFLKAIDAALRPLDRALG